MIAAALIASALAAPPPGLTDAGRPLPGPAAVIVGTPGFAATAYEPLVRALEDQGIDAWLLTFTPGAQSPATVVGDDIPAAIDAVRADHARVALVGHGLGGTLAAMSTAQGAAHPDALGLLGAPLSFPPLALATWLAARPVPPLGLDLPALAREGPTPTWNDLAILPLLLGEPLPPLAPVSAEWLTALAGWVQGGEVVSLASLPCPAWVGVTTLDNVAPPEAVRAHIGDATFVRFGYLRLDAEETDHAGLLRERVPTEALADAVRKALRGAAEGSAE